MAQFDVYPNPLEELRATHPYVVQVQSHFLKRPAAVMAVPLAPLDNPQHATVQPQAGGGRASLRAGDIGHRFV